MALPALRQNYQGQAVGLLNVVRKDAGSWKSKEAALAMKGEFLALLSKETSLPLHKVCTPIAAKARTAQGSQGAKGAQEVW